MAFSSTRGRWTRRSTSSAKLSGDDDGDYSSRHYRDRVSRQSTDSETSSIRRGLATSVTAFFSKLRPSKRPERGFTTQQTPIWRGDDGKSAITTVSSRYPTAETPGKRRASAGELPPDSADIIPPEFWNTPIPIPRRTHSVNSGRKTRRPVAEDTQRTPSTGSVRMISSRGNPASTGLTHDGAAAVPARKPVRNTNLTPVSSTPPTQSPSIARSSVRAREMFLAKQEARRQRRNLKATGDFLGVTGFNPQTGELDVITPTTSSEEGGVVLPESPSLTELAQKAEQAQVAYEQAKKEKKEETKSRETIKNTQGKQREGGFRFDQHGIKWRREEGQWSSVAEPRLSPIPQSRKNSMTAHSSDSTTIRREPAAPFLGMGAAPVAMKVIAKCRETSSSSESVEEEQTIPPIHPTGSSATATSSPSPRRRRTLRLSIPPLIPRRLGPSQKDTGSSPIDDPSPVPHGLMKQLSMVVSRPPISMEPPLCNLPIAPTRPSLELELENHNPAESWASTLMQDLDGLERSIEANSREMKAWAGSLVQNITGLGEVVRSVCTPITTTTGCGPSLQPADNGCGETGGMLQGGLSKALVGSTLTSAPSRTPVINDTCLDRWASRPGMSPSGWVSLPGVMGTESKTGTRVVEIPETTGPADTSPGLRVDTTLGRPQTPPEILLEGGRLYPVLPMTDYLQTEMRKTMRGHDKEGGQWMDISTSSQTYMSTSLPGRLSNNRSRSEARRTPMTTPTPRCTTMKRKKSGTQEGEAMQLNQAMAQGAARQAFVQRGDKTQSQTTTSAGTGGAVSDRPVRGAAAGGGGTGTRGSTSSGAGGVRGEAKTVTGAAKTVMETEAGHHHGGPDLAGTGTGGSWGPLIPLRITSAAAAKEDGGEPQMVVVQARTGTGDKQQQQQRELKLVKLKQPPPRIDIVGAYSYNETAAPVWLRKAMFLVRQLVYAYWRLVRPAFDAESPLRQRLGRKQCTGQDYGICMLAGLFVVLAGAAGVWMIRIMVGVWVLIGVLCKGVLVVLGFC